MHSIHFTLCNTFPESPPSDFSLKHLFFLLDKFDVKQRQEIMESAYFCYKILNENYEGDDWREKWYADFKSYLIATTPKPYHEQYVVYGILTYVLAKAVQKSDACRFKSLVEQHKQSIEEAKEYNDKGCPPIAVTPEGPIYMAAHAGV